MKKSAVASLISLICVNAVCLSFVTYAWYVSKQRIEHGSENVVAVDGGIVGEIEIFNILQSIDHVPGKRYFSDVPAENDEFILAEYSPLEKRCQSLVKVTLKTRFSSIGISAQVTSSDPYYIQPPTSTEENHKLKATGNPLSNITAFEIFKDDEGAIITHDEENGIYEMEFDEYKTRDTFVNSSCTAITTELNLGTIDDVSEFYILIGYNEASIDTIYSNYLGDPIISGETVKSLQFDVDYRFHLTDMLGEGN